MPRHHVPHNHFQRHVKNWLCPKPDRPAPVSLGFDHLRYQNIRRTLQPGGVARSHVAQRRRQLPSHTRSRVHLRADLGCLPRRIDFQILIAIAFRQWYDFHSPVRRQHSEECVRSDDSRAPRYLLNGVFLSDTDR